MGIVLCDVEPHGRSSAWVCRVQESGYLLSVCGKIIHLKVRFMPHSRLKVLFLVESLSGGGAEKSFPAWCADWTGTNST